MKAVFENATIADAFEKAARVAPTRGSAFDKANGILMSLDPNSSTVTLRATNLDVYYMEVVSAISVEGEGEWRFPSQIISGVLSKLPIGTGREVSLELKGSEVHLKSGRTTAKIRLSDASYFPSWEAFDPNALEVVPDLGARIQQVEWAALKNGDPPMSGIHLNGEYVMATDRIRMAITPCQAEPIYKPITIPSGILQPLMRTMRDVAIGIEEGQFLLMPDPTTQIRTVIFDVAYPPIERALKRNQPEHFKFKKQHLIDMIDRAMVFGARDRAPSMTMFIGAEEVAVMISDEDQGLLGDVLEVPGFAKHSRKKMIFTPKNLSEAVSASPSDEVTFYYDPENALLPVRIDGGSGYEAWVMPRRNLEQ